ncbi:cytochrome P450 [Dichomitus squalens]|uniref:Cytochrome P450 n=1 Tax=Dichomitus squalens TaxID=114155 RepID=A0A4Q9NVA0_9APHY|nr:cytochrome P450 [Dichomitus squalens]TBU53726.1 cytochrome P450 [Dichomitus squalens]
MEVSQGAVYGALAALLAMYILRWRRSPLYRIPTLGGPSDPVLSYWSAFNYLINSRHILREGYEKFHGSAFKIALLDSWMVIVNGSKLVEEIKRRSGEELSAVEETEEFLQIQYILGCEPRDDPYHVDLISGKLTRTLSAILPELLDELRVSLPEYVPTHDDEWATVDATTTMQRVVARLSNRAFVGLPICRDKEYLRLATAVAMDFVKDGFILKMFPQFLRPVVAMLTGSTKRTIRRTLPYLRPVIRERRSQIAEHGLGPDMPGKPGDMLQWIIEQAVPREGDDESIVTRVLLVNFASIHTASMSITHALYHLAAAPEYAEPLREEVMSVTEAHGWTKAAMGRMWKLDSFLKESQRYNGIALTTIGRKAIKDVILSDGTVIPAGTRVASNTYGMHFDNAYYPDADKFDPFRFLNIRKVQGESTKHQLVNTSNDYAAFGVGRHACPGRFFAAIELKAMLAYIVLNYDLKMSGDGARPPNMYIGPTVLPSMNGKILFRRRRTTGTS